MRTIRTVKFIFDPFFWSFVLALTLLPPTFCILESESISFLGGIRATCDGEGDEVPLETIKESNCYRCLCKNGFVECDSHECPSIEGCYSLLRRNKSDCCDRCKGCTRNGKYYNSGTEWTDEQNPCTIFSCKGGVITESNLKCYTPCSDPVPPGPGQCCPSCQKCYVNGQEVTAEMSVTTTEDPCVTCKCNRGHLICTKQACPVLHCPPSKIIHDPSECCPRCIGHLEYISDPHGGCMLGSRFYKSGTAFHIDECTHCSCKNATLSCITETCPVLECEKEYQIPGTCCPKCSTVVDKSRQACIYAGKKYQEGETWELDSCKSCACKNDKVQCAMRKCPPLITPCPRHSRIEVPEGQCCPRCVGNGVCTVFGDSYYRTFDGKFNEFKGRCKYLLASDSHDHSFSIRIANAAKSTRLSVWTKIITLKLNNVRIILGQRMRIKVNGERINVPYRLENKLEINRTSDSFLVTTNIGIKVLWDGISFVEVSAPTTYLNKLSGLCGNFNFNPKDDLMTRDGLLLRDNSIAVFEQSWAVKAKNKSCGQMKANVTNGKHCRGRASRRRNRLCDQLRYNKIFRPCHQKVNPTMYQMACMEDMCQCPTGKCYCQSFMAYVRECQRLDVQLPHWRKASKCRPVWDRPYNNVWQHH